MKIIHFNNGKILDAGYPIGSNMLYTIALSKAYGIHLCKNLKKIKKAIKINLWCRGSSGAIIATLVYNELCKLANTEIKICHIKKEKEFSHSSTPEFFAVTTFNEKRINYKIINIIVDDFISSGNTVNNIYKEALKFHDNWMGVNLTNFSINYLCISSGRTDNLVFEPTTLIIS